MNSILEDAFLLDCKTYDDYLDRYVTCDDLYYVQNIESSRMLVELGHLNVIYTPEEFENRKLIVYSKMYPTPTLKSLIMFHEGITITDPALEAFANRVKLNYQKTLSTIIFMRNRLKSGFELSGYIDFEDSLRKANLPTEDCTDWRAVFSMKIFLKPKTTDLSYHYSRTNVTHCNESLNYTTINVPNRGLTFMHKGDGKKIFVSENKPASIGDATKVIIFSPKYGHVILYDHLVKRKA